MANRYAIGSTWNSTASWATTSGGAGGASVPVSTDDVYFDLNSTSMSINATVNVANITLVGDFTGTVTQNANIDRVLGNYTQHAGTWNCNGYIFKCGTAVPDNWVVNAGGTFIEGAGTITVQGNVTNNAGTYTTSTGLFVHNDGGLFQGTTAFGNVTFTSISNRHHALGNCTVLGDCLLEVTGGANSWGFNGTGTMVLHGNLQGLGGTGVPSFTANKIKMVGVDRKIYSNEAGGAFILPQIEIDTAGGTLTLKDYLTVSGWAHTGGTIVADISSTLLLGTYPGGSIGCVFNAPNPTFNNFGTNRASNAHVNFTGTYKDAVAVEGNFLILGGGYLLGNTSGGTFNVKGDITSTALAVGGTSALNWVGTGSKILSSTTATGLPSGTFTVNGAGVLTLGSAVNLDGTGQDLLLTSGTLALAGYALTVNDRLIVQSSGVFLGGAGAVSAGRLTLSGGAFTSTSGTLTISGATDPLLKTGGTFVHNNGTVSFSNGSAKTITPSTDVYNNVSILDMNAGAITTISGTWDINGTLTTTGSGVLNIGQVNLSGNASLDHGKDVIPSTWTLRLDGTGNQTITGGALNEASFGSLVIASTGGTVAFVGTFVHWVNTITYVSGVVDMAGSTFKLRGTSGTRTIDTGNIAFGNVEWLHVGASNETTNITGTMFIGGDLTFTQCNSITGTIDVKGSISVTDSGGVNGTASIIWSGSGSQTMTLDTATHLPSGTFTVAGASTGVLTLGSAVSLDGTLQNLAITSGILDLAGFNLTVQNNINLNTTGTLRLEGGEVITRSSFTNSGTVEFYGAGEYTGFPTGLGYAFAVLRMIGTGIWHMEATDISAATFYARNVRLRSAFLWMLSVSGSATAYNVTVENSDANGGNTVIAHGSVSVNNSNLNWSFSLFEIRDGVSTRTIEVVPQDVEQVGTMVRGASGQVANISQWLDPSGDVRVAMGPDGALIASKAEGTGIKIDISAPTFGFKDLLGVVITDPLGADAPALAAYKTDVGGVREYAYDANDRADMRFHVPHDWVPGTNLFFHVHWSHNGTAISGTFSANIYFSYAKGHNQAAFSAVKTATISYATADIATTPRWQHRIDEIQLSSAVGDASHIPLEDIETDGVLLIGLEMTAIPAITGGTGQPFIHYMDIHYQSTQLATKQKAPPFYV